ncbi:39S ribosomal protein L50, mitochondrial-like isoform X2 [Passer montanus]|uniref:39S ribosomal protein L50, mitochondrial-like isoform X2 n=1 Tax=Passer montanus TaxID=9160 RepID=UPI00196081C8|nr:39S ribosomal protein L50, mitochondrial-like isoform X2 [Passer montanus]
MPLIPPSAAEREERNSRKRSEPHAESRIPAGAELREGGRRERPCGAAQRIGKEGREVEADGAVPEKEERSEASLIRPPPRRRSYVPPQDLQSCLESHVREVFGPAVPEDWQQAPLQETRLKHRLLARLAAELGHAVPNSQLHRMRRAGDVLGFYRSPVKDGTEIDELAAAELPPNLKIIWQQ